MWSCMTLVQVHMARQGLEMAVDEVEKVQRYLVLENVLGLVQC